MKYELHIDARAMRECLAEIEQGNPQRMFPHATFSGAWATANAVRFAAGLPMLAKPRKGLPGPGTVVLTRDGETMDVRIVRRGEA